MYYPGCRSFLNKINKIVSRSYKCLRIIACCRMRVYQQEWHENLVCGFVGRSLSPYQNANTYRFGANNIFVGIATMSKNAPPMRSFVFALARCKIRVRIGSSDDCLCDVYDLQQQFSRGFLDLPQDDCTIRKGRNEMVNALRNNQVAPQ